MAVLRIHAPVLGQQERVFEWDGRPITVGRDDACDVVLLEQAASRHHARLERHGDEIRVHDCDSANGVWVGSERVLGSRVLHDGEVIRIGDTTLALVLDPHRQPTLLREPVGGPPGLERAATVTPAQAATPVAREDIGSGPTLAASSAPVAVSSPTPPAVVVPPRAPAPVVVPVRSPSAYSLGAEPTIAGESGPNLLGMPDRSAPSVYSIGDADTIAPHGEPAALGRPLASSASVYSLGRDVAAQSHEPESFGQPLASSASVYSLGPAPHGPDVRLPPAPVFEGVPSSVELGAPPPRPALHAPPGLQAPAPRPPAPIAPSGPGSSPSSWAWVEPAPAPRHPRSAAAGPTLWLGLGLLIGGVIAIIVALAAGYEPSELTSRLGATDTAAATGGGR